MHRSRLCLCVLATSLALGACASAAPPTPTIVAPAPTPKPSQDTGGPATQTAPTAVAAASTAAVKPEGPSPEVAKAEVSTEPVAAVPPKAVDPGFQPRKGAKFKVLMVGDSMAATDFGRELEQRLDAHKKVRCDRRGKSATGLARPDYFDWMGEGKKRVVRHNPDLVVVIIGGNDGQDLKPKTSGRRVFWKGKKWAKAYKARLKAFADLLMADGRRLVWLELPAMDHRSLEKKLALIRRLQKEVVAELGDDATYVVTRDWFYKNKTLLKRAKVKGYKKPQVLRQDDGIHFTVPGSKYFANRVLPKVLSALELSE